MPLSPERVVKGSFLGRGDPGKCSREAAAHGSRRARPARHPVRRPASPSADSGAAVGGEAGPLAFGEVSPFLLLQPAASNTAVWSAPVLSDCDRYFISIFLPGFFSVG